MNVYVVKEFKVPVAAFVHKDDADRYIDTKVKETGYSYTVDCPSGEMSYGVIPSLERQLGPLAQPG